MQRVDEEGRQRGRAGPEKHVGKEEEGSEEE